MDNAAFKAAYAESRNGTNGFYRHPLVRNFRYSDGVQKCAEAGCYWLLDIFATELPAIMRRLKYERVTLGIKVRSSGTALISAHGDEDALPIWKRSLTYTDMPVGEWKFFLAQEGPEFALILFTEY